MASVGGFSLAAYIGFSSLEAFKDSALEDIKYGLIRSISVFHIYILLFVEESIDYHKTEFIGWVSIPTDDNNQAHVLLFSYEKNHCAFNPSCDFICFFGADIRTAIHRPRA